MSLLIGALTIGFILSLLALGVFISFGIFSFPDITADGSSALGAAVAQAASLTMINLGALYLVWRSLGIWTLPVFMPDPRP